MQLKDVTPIIKEILAERDNIPVVHNTDRYIPHWTPWHAGNFMRGGIRKALRAIEQAPVVDAVPVVRCKDCKNRGTPYSCPMRKLVMPFQGAGSYEDCTEDDGYCHMGVKMDGGAKGGMHDENS